MATEVIGSSGEIYFNIKTPHDGLNGETDRLVSQEEIEGLMKQASNKLVERFGGEFFPWAVRLRTLVREGAISQITYLSFIEDILKTE